MVGDAEVGRAVVRRFRWSRSSPARSRIPGRNGRSLGRQGLVENLGRALVDVGIAVGRRDVESLLRQVRNHEVGDREQVLGCHGVPGDLPDDVDVAVGELVGVEVTDVTNGRVGCASW